ncbi:hypothetical protein ASG11_02860 [Sphingomonas sp. Leaf357]|uniref:hypothetical protein n=1 Tax=Sphingomonas sp. Leaf357 TaxID=1736350 RepID=UPI0006FD4653|nr:hypothetical protein [Sphingomonas sp. Leaf357]KQS03329.1 hypothetical protein ASG11_02860 [Sphingomonas sp. Leaf357]
MAFTRHPIAQADLVDLLLSRNGSRTCITTVDGEPMKVREVEVTDLPTAVEWDHYAALGGVGLSAEDGKYFFYSTEIDTVEDSDTGRIIFARNVGTITLSVLQARLANILLVEEASAPDWFAVEQLCQELDRELDASGDDVPEIVTHFLSDADIRARDRRYGDTQREAIRLYVATGKYDDGVALPWWGCLALLVLIGAMIAWASA